MYSNAELTAVDLVQYSHLIGGLPAAATVIDELVEKTDFERCGDRLVKVTTFPTLQRLGFLLDVVLENETQADAVYGILQPYVKDLKYRPLITKYPTEKAERSSKWKIIINQEIEPDEWY